MDVLSYIVNHATTGMTFYQMAESLNNNRLTEYVNRKAQYMSSSAVYTHSVLALSQDPGEFLPFSAYDDKGGYCETSINDEFIIMIFEKYVNDHRAEMNTMWESIPVSPVLSMDNTFNISKRVVEYDRNSKLYIKNNKTSYLFTMGCDNTIQDYCPAIGSQGDYHRAALTRIVDKCKRQQCDLPKHIVVDTCCESRPLIQR